MKEIEVDQIEKEFSISFLFFIPIQLFFLFSSFCDSCLLYLVDERINNIWIWWWAHVSKAVNRAWPQLVCLISSTFDDFLSPTLFFLGQKWNLWSHTRYRSSSTKIFHCDPNSFRFSCPFFLNIYSVSSVINHLSEMTKQKWKFPVHGQVEGRKNTIFREDSVPRGFRYRYSKEEAGCLVPLK